MATSALAKVIRASSSGTASSNSTKVITPLPVTVRHHLKLTAETSSEPNLDFDLSRGARGESASKRNFVLP